MDTYYDWVDDDRILLYERKREIAMRYYRKIYFDNSHLSKLNELIKSSEIELQRASNSSKSSPDCYAYYNARILVYALSILKNDIITNNVAYWAEGVLAEEEKAEQAKKKKKLNP